MRRKRRPQVGEPRDIRLLGLLKLGKSTLVEFGLAAFMYLAAGVLDVAPIIKQHIKKPRRGRFGHVQRGASVCDYTPNCYYFVNSKCTIYHKL